MVIDLSRSWKKIFQLESLITHTEKNRFNTLNELIMEIMVQQIWPFKLQKLKASFLWKTGYNIHCHTRSEIEATTFSNSRHCTLCAYIVEHAPINLLLTKRIRFVIHDHTTTIPSCLPSAAAEVSTRLNCTKFCSISTAPKSAVFLSAAGEGWESMTQQ